MTKFISVQDVVNGDMLINVEHISYIRVDGTGAVRMTLADNSEIICRDSVELIKKKLDACGALSASEMVRKGTPILKLDVDNRLYNILRRCGIQSIEELKDYSDIELLRMNGIGEESVAAVRSALERYEERKAKSDV